MRDVEGGGDELEKAGTRQAPTQKASNIAASLKQDDTHGKHGALLC
jgi:hypothetical protein